MKPIQLFAYFVLFFVPTHSQQYYYYLRPVNSYAYRTPPHFAQQTHYQYSAYPHNYYSSYGRQPVQNVITDPIWGGPTSLGWAQVPRHLSPMYSPVYGG